MASVAAKQTAARAAKSKKPLSDMHQLQRAVRELQRESADQLMLEVESQATFEFLTSQIKALKAAFDTLSDVLLGEIDSLRKETHRRVSEIDAHVTRQGELHKATHAEVMQLKRTMEVWSLKERDWAKDNELLKASHTHNVEWMQQLQRDVMDVKDRAHELRGDVSGRITALCDETNNLRTLWQRQLDDVTERLSEIDGAAQRHASELRALNQQRADDLELLEQALSTVQKQQAQVRTNVEDHVQSVTAQHALLLKKVEWVEAQSGAQHAALEQLRHKSTALEKEQRRRMDSIGKMFTVRAFTLRSNDKIERLMVSTETIERCLQRRSRSLLRLPRWSCYRPRRHRLRRRRPTPAE
ncbi:hypothetical protein PINS_up002548 [Pythium insidiosum]|nr:hypothetical protein PINS_up002548 [Pythium insidiosum]